MIHSLKHHFIPHAGNNHHAPVLHRKRHVWYSLVAIVAKGIVVLSTILLPLEVFVTPDALDAQLAAIVEETNALRQSVGERPLTVHPQLHRSADLKAADMREQQYFSHTSPTGVGVAAAIRRGGYEFQFAGENLAMGFRTAKEVVRAWEASPTHYRNLVHPVFQDIGVGIAIAEHNGSPVPYVVQHFGTPKGTDVSVLGSFVDDTEIVVLPQSRVFWKEIPEGIHIEPQIFINKEVQAVTITEFRTDIPLERKDSLYTAEYILLADMKTLFQPTLPVSIMIETIDGDIIESIVPWHDPPLVHPSVLDRYHMATAYVRDIVPLVVVSNTVLLIGIGMLIFALIGHIVWSVHKKKHSITFEAVLVLALFVVLFLV